tara:strand:- start:481 stop:861 length:381 start_codon:yes stop_codon:yes gene_type:complete
MKVYIAGPMTNCVNNNFRAFDNARDILEMQGHTVVSPADLDREGGYDPYTGTQPRIVPDRRTCMKRDLPALLDCDVVVFLPSSGVSEGAKIERGVALYSNIPCHEFIEFIGVNPMFEDESVAWCPA